MLLSLPALAAEGGESPASGSAIVEMQEQLEKLQDELGRLKEESEARKQLELTEEEERAEQEDILDAAGRNYTLMKPGKLGLEYNFNYTYYSYDSVTQVGVVEHKANHNLENSIFLEYPLWENLTLNTEIPFVYKFNSSSGDSNRTSDIGDLSLGAQYQPFKAGGNMPTTILSARFTVPVGRSPYDIDPSTETATSSGLYALNLGANVSKVLDPLVAYGGASFTYRMKESGLRYHAAGKANTNYITDVDPGALVGFNMGFGYALSYMVNLNVSWQYTFRMKTEYTWVAGNTVESNTSSSSMLNIGTGWRLSPKRNVNIRVGLGLTNDDPDFTLSVRVPFEFDL